MSKSWALIAEKKFFVTFLEKFYTRKMVSGSLQVKGSYLKFKNLIEILQNFEKNIMIFRHIE